MKPILPIIKDRLHFSSLFKDNTNWDQAIRYLVEQHQLPGQVQRGTLGSHIVYRVGDVWIKLMAPIYNTEMIYEVSGLKSITGKLSVATPEILSEGILEGWPYIILSHVKGDPIKKAWSQFSNFQKTKIAKQIGETVTEIKTIQAEDAVLSRFEWNTFIKEQYENCEAQQKSKLLPESWLPYVSPFLKQFDLSEFQTKQPVFLHADLTYDHFLISDGKEPLLSGIIDMADCQVGHPEYELCAPSSFTFVKDREHLRNFLLAYGYAPTELNNRFSEKLLAWGLLHRYFGIVTRFKNELESLPAGDFSALAQKLYPL
jgi:hygromycin-B 7''-O-kinase